MTRANRSSLRPEPLEKWYDEATLRLMGLEDTSTTLDLVNLTTNGTLGFNENIARKVIDAAGVSPRLVLDLGCGLGNASTLFAREYGARVVAVDLVREFLDYAAARSRSIGLQDLHCWVQADLRTGIPVALDSFDLIIISSVHEIFGNMRGLLRTIETHCNKPPLILSTFSTGMSDSATPSRFEVERYDPGQG